jgi:hypothetical protein
MKNQMFAKLAVLGVVGFFVSTGIVFAAEAPGRRNH